MVKDWELLKDSTRKGLEANDLRPFMWDSQILAGPLLEVLI